MKNLKFSTIALFALLANMMVVSHVNAMTFDFTFSGLCDDCAFAGSPGDIEFEPTGDGLFESVSGVLSLNSIALVDGLIPVDSNTFVSFTYHGSNLINPFSFDDAFTIVGNLNPDGSVNSNDVLVLESSDGVDGTFDFGDFCTATGAAVFGSSCFGVGLVAFELSSAGDWLIEGVEAFDVGVGGQLTPVPVPLTLPLLISGLAAVGWRVRQR